VIMPLPRPARTRPAAPLRDRHGTSAVEFCVVAPLVLMAFALVADLGNAVQQSLRLETAARAGAQYALTFPTDAAAIQAEVRRALPDWGDVTVEVPA
jgi:Flp pilus assembly protein TadG